MESIQKRKEELSKKLEMLKNPDLIESPFLIMGKFGCVHSIDTNLSMEVHGIIPGQFIFSTFCGDKLALCVGLGKNNDPVHRDLVLWFLVEGDNGIRFFERGSLVLNTWNLLQENIGAVLVP